MDSARPLLTEEPAYKALLQYFNDSGTKLNMAQMFQQDPGRFSKFRCVSVSLTFHFPEGHGDIAFLLVLLYRPHITIPHSPHPYILSRVWELTDF